MSIALAFRAISVKQRSAIGLDHQIGLDIIEVLFELAKKRAIKNKDNCEVKNKTKASFLGEKVPLSVIVHYYRDYRTCDGGTKRGEARV